MDIHCAVPHSIYIYKRHCSGMDTMHTNIMTEVHDVVSIASIILQSTKSDCVYSGT